MMRKILIVILIICSIESIASLLSFGEFGLHQLRGRKLNQKIIQKQNQQVHKVTHKQKYFQSYHFQLDISKPRVQFYIDTLVNDQLKGHIKLLWKYKNTYVLPHVLQSEKVYLQILQEEDKIGQEIFYTKAGFKINGKKDKLYKIIVFQKKQAIITKLVTLNVEHFLQYFQEPHNFQEPHGAGQEEQIKNVSKILSRQGKYVEKEEDSWSEESGGTWRQSEQKYPYQDKVQGFELVELQERIELLLNQTKLLVNEAYTKHLAEQKIENSIEDSIQIYWNYELTECGIVLLCVFLQILMVRRLFNCNTITQLI